MTAPIETGTILDRILAQTALDLEARKRATPYADVERRAMEVDVAGSLRSAISAPGTSVIAEYKRASPSKGRFPVEIEPVVLASEYAEGGARAISVLTDEPFFQGSIADLTAAATVAHSNHPALAVLRKDFILDEYQILEARAAAADAILLIVGALGQPALTRLLDFAGAIGLDALVEVHDEEELGRAEAAGARIIGVNNRDLRTFAVDLATTERLASIRSQPSLLVAESGIHNRADVERLEAAGADAVLVGESLVLAKDRSAAIRHLRGDSARR